MRGSTPTLRRVTKALCVIVAFAAVVLAGSYLAWGLKMEFSDREWVVAPNVLSPGRSGDNRRARMVDDLLRHHLKTGMSAHEVSAILGEPDCGGNGHRFYELLWLPRPDQELVAWLKWRSARPLLAVQFAADAKGTQRVVRAEVARDIGSGW